MLKEIWERIKPSVRKFLLEALAGFIFWTVILSPYMIFVVKTDFAQYWKWVLMEIILIAPFAPLSVRFIGWFAKRFRGKK